MLRHTLTALLLLSCFALSSQNDVDAMRYSQTGFGGTSRSRAMAGSFGALGADGACMGINPAGIGLFKTGQIDLSVGLRFNSVNANYNNTNSSDFKTNFVYNGFSFIKAFDGKQDPNNHHALGVSVNQLANFNSNATIQGYSRHTRMNDIVAQAGNSSPATLDPSYAGMAFQNYILDTVNGHYYSFVDPTKSTKQNDQIQTSGHYNELNFNYAYGYKDKLYIGAAVGVPIVSFNYTSVYKETDDKDSMRLSYNSSSGNVSSTYPYDVYYYTGLGGFKEFSYTETYKTSGTGVNLKLGAIYRVTDYLRIGASYQSPTMLKLTDTYIYQMTTTFDEGGSQKSQYPDNGGRFSYKIITPSRFTGSVAYLYKKLGSINVDYETVDYSQANLQNVSGGSVQADFSGVNNTIRSTYTRSTNLRVGVEANVKQVFIRLGYAMYGSPYGATFSGSQVKNYICGGIGFRSNKWYFDFSLVRQMSKDNFYMFNPKYADKSTLTNSGTTIAATVGCKF